MELRVRTRNVGGTKYSHNQEYFEQPSLENAYWAGLIAADGCIIEDRRLITPASRLSLKLAKRDRVLLDLFKQCVQYTGPVRFDPNNGTEGAVILHINRAYKLIQDLQRHYHIGTRKSLTLEGPSDSLTKAQKLAYIKGYIDGDGCIHTYQAKSGLYPIRLFICGSQYFLEWVSAIFNELAPPRSYVVSKPRKTSSSKIWEYIVSGRRALDVLSVLNDIPVVGLERKWHKYSLFLQSLK